MLDVPRDPDHPHPVLGPLEGDAFIQSFAGRAEAIGERLVDDHRAFAIRAAILPVKNRPANSSIPTVSK